MILFESCVIIANVDEKTDAVLQNGFMVGGVCEMAKCEICGKSVTFGLKVSHSNRKTNRTWKPNIRKVKAVVNGTHKSMYVCTRCLRSDAVTRA